MKTYNSNYLGICINNNDPEYRGRVQVFVPHIMPTLYEKWNMDGQDIQINAIGENLEGALAPEILEKLTKILPWAEAASPIICPSAPGQAIKTQDGRTVYNQSPVNPEEATAYESSTPLMENSTPIQSEKDLLQKAKGLTGEGTLGASAKNNFDAILNDKLALNCGSQGACARGAVAIAGAMTDAPDLKKGSAGANASQFSLGGSADNNNNVFATARDNSGRPLYEKIPFRNFTGGYTPVKGDVIFGGGHAQTFIGTQNVREGNNSVVKNIYISDFKQDHILGQTQRDNGAVVYRLTPAGLAQAAKTSPGLFQEFQQQGPQQPLVMEITNSSGQPPAAPTPVQAVPPTTVTPPVTAEETAANQTSAPQQNFIPNQLKKIADNALNGPNGFKLVGDQVSMDLNGSPNSAALEGGRQAPGQYQPGKGTGNPQTSFMFSNNSFANGATDVFIAVPSASLVGKPFALRNNNTGKTIIAYGMDVGDSQRTFQKGHLEISAGAFVALGLPSYVMKGNSAVTVGTPNVTVAPILGSSLPNIASKNISREKYEKLIGNPLTDAQKQALENQQYGNLTEEQKKQLQITQEQIANAEKTGRLVQNTDPGGAHPITNTNNLAKGMFSYPAVGAMLWVFFREGNPLYPVYFAASYSAAEWKSAYNNKSPAPGNPGAAGNPPGVATSRSILHTGTGGFTSDCHIDQEDITNNMNKFSVFGPNAELTFADSGSYAFHRRNLREHVEGDKHKAILGNYEKFVQGTSNNVYLGQHIEIHGLFTEETMAAAMELQTLLEDEVYGPFLGTSFQSSGNASSQNKTAQ